MALAKVSDAIVADGVESNSVEDELRGRSGPEASGEQQAKLNEEKIKEQKQRRTFRWVMFVCFFLLLLGQHGLLCWFIGVAIANGFIGNIQPLLTIIMPATLGETYFIMREMVHFVFTPGDFSLRGVKKDMDEPES